LINKINKKKQCAYNDGSYNTSSVDRKRYSRMFNEVLLDVQTSRVIPVGNLKRGFLFNYTAISDNLFIVFPYNNFKPIARLSDSWGGGLVTQS